MSFNKLKGEAILDFRINENGDTSYAVYYDNYFICGTLGCNKEKLKEMIKRSNEYDELVTNYKREQILSQHYIDRNLELSEQNRELLKLLKTVKCTHEELKYDGELGLYEGDYKNICEVLEKCNKNGVVK